LESPLGEQFAMPFLEEKGITKQGDTYYFTYEEKNYTAKVEEGKYTVTQDDTEHYLEYDEEQNYMFYRMTYLTEEETRYTFETKLIDQDFAMQLYDIENQKLVQIMTEIEMLEITVSVQEEVATQPSDISEGVDQDFATEGEIYLINEGLLEEYA
jgi:hypothetical protein